MIVVSNTSPIINMAAVGRLDLLQQLYEKVVIPQAVYNEITVVGAGQPGAMEVQTVDWIEAKEVTNRILVTALQAELYEGEAEAIALAIQLKAHLLLLDERRGRAVASRLGLRFIGLLGVLVEAKQKGYISRVKPLLDDLMAKASFWVSHQLYARVLREVGE
jgi:predicted nucleic acid-binding protein